MFSLVYPFIFFVVIWAPKAEFVGCAVWLTNAECCFSFKADFSTTYGGESVLASQASGEMGAFAAVRQRGVLRRLLLRTV